MHRSVLILFLFISVNAIGQSDFKLVDSTSYALFSQKKWKQLAKFGRKPLTGQFDYYYLNMRLGIANYELGKFYTAEKYLQRALEQNRGTGIAAEYLYWIYLATGRTPEAYDMISLMPDSSKRTILEQQRRIAQYIYLEGGPKFSNRKEVASTMLYGNIGINFQLSPKLSLYHSYTWIQQELLWGKYQQHQLFLAPQYLFRKGWRMSSTINYFSYTRSFDYINSFSNPISSNSLQNIRYDTAIHTETRTYGNLRLNSLYARLNLTKRINGFSITPHVAWHLENSQPDYSQTIRTDTVASVTENQQQISSDVIGSGQRQININTTSTVDYLQLGASASWTFFFNRYKYLEAGLEYLTLVREQEMTRVLVPFFSAGISYKFALQGYFLKKGYFPVSLFGGSIVLNNYDKLAYRFSLTGRYNISRQSLLYVTLQQEHIRDGLTFESYDAFAVFTGFRIQF